MIKSHVLKVIFTVGIFIFLSSVKADAEGNAYGSIFPEKSKSLAMSHFTWGVDLGSSIDLTANNLSTFDAEASFGYKNSFFRLVGAGAGIRKAFGSGNMFIPVYGVLRTSFGNTSTPLFLNLQAGYSFNTITDTESKGGFNLAVGVGFNLAMSRLFRSHIMFSYGFMHINRHQLENIELSNSNISMAKIAIGVNF